MGAFPRRCLEVAALVLAGALGGLGSFVFHPDRPMLYLEDEPLEEGEVRLSRVLEEWGADGVVWIDARVREEFENGHVAGAVLLNEQEWQEVLFGGAAEVIFDAADKPMIVYCGSYACQASKKVAERMMNEMGVPEVYVLRGGWKTIAAANAVDGIPRIE